MKKLIVLITVLSSFIFSQSINTQGVLRDANGFAKDDGNYDLTFRIYGSETGGAAVWTGQYSITVTNGVFNATLGDDVNPVNMLAGSASYWLSIAVGTDGEMTPRLKLNTSPYEMAYLSGAENVFPGAGSVGIGTTSPASKLHVKAGDSHTRLTIERSSNAREAFLQFRTGGVNKALIGLDNNMDGLSFYSYDGAGRMATFNNTTGFLGIGTSNPLDRLHVDGDIRIADTGGIKNSALGNYILQTGSNTTFSNFTAINSGWGWEAMYEPVSLVASQFGFYVTKATTAGTPFGETVFNVDLNGNVGIRTTNPGTQVSMDGGMTINGTGSTHMTIQKGGLNSFALNVSEVIDGDVHFFDRVGGSSWNQAICMNSGYVGINGIDTPTKPLHIYDDSSNPIRIESSGASTADALSVLNSAPNSTLLFGGIYRNAIYFYWKDDLGNKYMHSPVGYLFGTARTEMGDGNAVPLEELVNTQEARITALEEELAEIKALLESN